MPRVCTICSHKNRCAIDQSVVSGRPISRIATDFDVGPKALERHVKAGHVAKIVQAAQAEADKKAGLDIAKCVQEIYEIATSSAKMAQEKGQLNAVGSCLNAASKALEIIGKGKEDDDVPGIDRAIKKLIDAK